MQLHTTKAVMAMLEEDGIPLSRATLENWLKRGVLNAKGQRIKLRYRKYGGAIRISQTALDDFFRQTNRGLRGNK